MKFHLPKIHFFGRPYFGFYRMLPT